MTRLLIEELACPRCGHRKDFHIDVAATAYLDSSGTSVAGDHVWDAKSVCTCLACHHEAPAGDFAQRTEEPPASDRDRRLDHVRQARVALEAYQGVTGIGSDDEAVADIIADLGHFADCHDIDFLDCCTRAIAAWAVERQGPHATAATPNVVIEIAGGVP